VERAEKKFNPGWMPLSLYYAIVKQPLCKACRAEEVLTGTKKETFIW
jgi:hypothetical protein